MKDVTAIIMGGGRGSRLLPLTLERTKPAVGFAGKYRLIDIPISNCINSGAKRIFVLTQFLSASLHRHIMQTYMFDTFTDGFVDILAAEQTRGKGEDWFQGTADAVRSTLRHTTHYQSDQLLILSGDHLYRMHYKKLVEFHRQSGADITLGVYPVTPREAPELGLLRTDNDGRVRQFVEKPTDPAVIDDLTVPPGMLEAQGLHVEPARCCLASMGIYVFEPKALFEVLADVNRTDFGKDVIPSAIDQYRVMAWPFADYWKDIGTIDNFFEANIALAQPDPPFALYAPGWPTYTRTRSLPPSRIVGSEIRDCLVVEGSNVTGACISDSIVGTRSVIGEGAVLDHVVMLGADFYEGEKILMDVRGQQHPGTPLGIGRHCRIERAIIDKNACIGDNVTIRSKAGVPDRRGDRYWIVDGITIIPRGAVLSSGTEI